MATAALKLIALTGLRREERPARCRGAKSNLALAACGWKRQNRPLDPAIGKGARDYCCPLPAVGRMGISNSQRPGAPS